MCVLRKPGLSWTGLFTDDNLRGYEISSERKWSARRHPKDYIYVSIKRISMARINSLKVEICLSNKTLRF